MYEAKEFEYAVTKICIVYRRGAIEGDAREANFTRGSARKTLQIEDCESALFYAYKAALDKGVKASSFNLNLSGAYRTTISTTWSNSAIQPLPMLCQTYSTV